MNAVLQDGSLHYQDMPSPVGRLRLIASDSALVGIWFEQGRDAARHAGGLVEKSSPVLELRAHTAPGILRGAAARLRTPARSARHRTSSGVSGSA
jgi:hypothetical protein